MKRRLFIGIDLSAETKIQCGKIIDRLQMQYPEVVWEAPKNLHITLKFLGLTEELPRFIGQTVAEKIHPFLVFSIVFDKVSVFVGEKSIVILDVIKNESLLKLFYMISNCLEEFGFKRGLV